MQGTSLDAAVIDLGPKMFTTGMAYVALSRLRDINGLAIVGLHPKSTGFASSKSAIKEISRLRQKAQTSTNPK
jgi:hypothetical protein